MMLNFKRHRYHKEVIFNVSIGISDTPLSGA